MIGIERAAALIEITYGKNPFELTDEEFARLASNAMWFHRFKAELLEKAIERVMVPIFCKE